MSGPIRLKHLLGVFNINIRFQVVELPAFLLDSSIRKVVGSGLKIVGTKAHSSIFWIHRVDEASLFVVS